jgi:hypothetical protein
MIDILNQKIEAQHQEAELLHKELALAKEGWFLDCRSSSYCLKGGKFSCLTSLIMFKFVSIFDSQCLCCHRTYTYMF